MMTIGLGKTYFNAIDGHRVDTVWFKDIELPCGIYSMRDTGDGLPDIRQAYDALVNQGMSQEDIINKLIAAYLPLRVFKVGRLDKVQLVIGFIGVRGAGKTCGAVATATLDYLIRGKQVWSNVPIEVKVCYRDASKVFSSIPLDQLDMLDLEEGYTGGCVVIDEVNLTAAEGSRYMSAANLAFANTMQQVRKRELNILWTCQGWGWLDSRLRWQTDFTVACGDASRGANDGNRVGERSVWHVMDLSGISGRFDWDFGIKHRYISQYEIWRGIVFQRPFWQAYSTRQLQSGNYRESYKAGQKAKKEGIQGSSSLRSGPAEIAAAIVRDSKVSRLQRIACSDIWQNYNIIDQIEQSDIGRVLVRHYKWRKRRNDSGAFYEVS